MRSAFLPDSHFPSGVEDFHPWFISDEDIPDPSRKIVRHVLQVSRNVTYAGRNTFG